MPITLSGPVAYVAAPGALAAADVTSGRYLWGIHTRETASDGGSADTPLMATVNGRPVVVAASVVTVPGQGTTPSTSAVEVIAADARTGQKVLDDLLPAPSGDDTFSDSHCSATTIGADDRTVVVEVFSEFGNITFTDDVTSHRLRWSRKNFTPAALVGGSVIGVSGDHVADHNRVQALGEFDQARRWVVPGDLYQVSAQVVGPGLIAVLGKNYGDGGAVAKLIDAKTGRRRYAWFNQTSDYSCQYDEASVAVCVHSGEDQVVGFDVATGKSPWYLPKGGRVAPTVTWAWHGAVYGTTSNGPVVLDARTGRDRQDSPGIAPVVADAYAGIAVDDTSGQVMIYPAVG